MHAITLFDTTLADTGTYSCTAINAQSEKWHEYLVKVKRIFTQFYTNI